LKLPCLADTAQNIKNLYIKIDEPTSRE